MPTLIRGTFLLLGLTWMTGAQLIASTTVAQSGTPAITVENPQEIAAELNSVEALSGAHFAVNPGNQITFTERTPRQIAACEAFLHNTGNATLVQQLGLQKFGINPARTRFALLHSPLRQYSLQPPLTDDELRSYQRYAEAIKAMFDGKDAALIAALMHEIDLRTAASVPPFQPLDLHGEWQGNYGNPESPGFHIEKIRIEQDRDTITAIKLTGNAAIPAGQIAFRGPYRSPRFHAQIQVAGLNYANPHWLPTTVTVEDADHINVGAAQIFERVTVIPLGTASCAQVRPEDVNGADAVTRAKQLIGRQQYADAACWFKIAAGKENVKGLSSLAALYFFGLGLPKQPAEALRLYLRAANLGDLQSEINVSHMYETGQGTPPNHPEAIRWLEVAQTKKAAIAAKAAAQQARDAAQAATLLLLLAAMSNPAGARTGHSADPSQDESRRLQYARSEDQRIADEQQRQEQLDRENQRALQDGQGCSWGYHSLGTCQ